jgi:hypothetical protein
MHKSLFGVVLVAVCLSAANAQAAPIVFTPLTGALVGGSPAATAVYKADLSGNGTILSLSIADNSAGLGGAAGEFSGFDLDAIILSYDDITDSSQLGTVTPLAVFDFSTGGTFFFPGAQRPPSDPKLFGTDATGSQVDNGVARLGLFDGNSTTAIPGADGFLSMGDNGVLTFNLTSPLNTTGLRLYIGEVGDNGEVAAARVTVSQTAVPEPGTMTLIGSGLLGLARACRRRRSAA